MPDLRRRDQLDQALLELGDHAMVLVELDGFIAGLLVCPDLIPPGEWFAKAVGLSKRHPSPFTDLDHANDVLELVMDYYHDVATTLTQRPQDYRPLFSIDNVNGDVIWELWIEGFATAARLRPRAFTRLLDGGGEPAAAIAGLATLTDIAERVPDPVDKEPEPLSIGAPERIRQWIVTLHQHRLAAPRSSASFTAAKNPFAGAPKVGRNDPCPCGSGKKYKRCCGLN
jgi:uncharacterized protein